MACREDIVVKGLDESHEDWSFDPDTHVTSQASQAGL